MIIEKYRELQELTQEEKALLAQELWEEALESKAESPADPEIARLLDERWKEFLEDPSTAYPWSEVKRRLREKSGFGNAS